MTEQKVEIEQKQEEKPKELYSILGHKRYELELTEEEANFLDSKGPSFTDLWARRLKEGMKPVLRARFDEMVAEFVKSEANASKQEAQG